MDLEKYNEIRAGSSGCYIQSRGLIAVWGKEAVQFLDGLISNNVKILADGEQMLAAFPNAQGRLLAVVRVLRQGDRFLLETEAATCEKIYQNLFRFTFAGDFFVEDVSERYSYFDLIGDIDLLSQFVLGLSTDEPVVFEGRGTGIFVPSASAETFQNSLNQLETTLINDELYETLRIECGVPKYGVDMDETTIVPELGMDGLISYNKGCYIGQEIIARIHFRGHVAKRLTGIMSEPGAVRTGLLKDTELTTSEGKSAGRITSVTYSPKLERNIALAYVRHDYLAEGTELMAGGQRVTVKNLPFI